MSSDGIRSFLHFDPQRAAEQLQREHDALANLAGSDNARIDGLVQDVGAIKGSVNALGGEVGRANEGIKALTESMTVLNRHSVLMERQAEEQAQARKDREDLDKRLRVIEGHMPGLIEMRKIAMSGFAGLAVLVGGAVLALVLK
jgi:outer membrane murein-binding lipoprotein Lpp